MIKLPAILGWLVVGIILGPYLAGVIIGREIIFKKIAKSGKQIIAAPAFSQLSI